MSNIKRFNDLISLTTYTANVVFTKIKTKIKTGEANIILAGGKTPKKCYTKLSTLINTAGGLNLKNTYWYPGDERWVPSGHPDSNEGMIRDLLFSEMDFGKVNFFGWNTEAENPVEAAEQYNTMLKKRFSERNVRPDVVLLGMGDDGHTASLFPDGEFVVPDSVKPAQPGHHRVNPNIKRNAAAVYRKKYNMWRLSMTAHFLNTAELVIFMIHGEAKHDAFLKLLSHDYLLPVSWIHGKKTLYLVTESINPPPITS